MYFHGLNTKTGLQAALCFSLFSFYLFILSLLQSKRRWLRTTMAKQTQENGKKEKWTHTMRGKRVESTSIKMCWWWNVIEKHKQTVAVYYSWYGKCDAANFSTYQWTGTVVVPARGCRWWHSNDDDSGATHKGQKTRWRCLCVKRARAMCHCCVTLHHSNQQRQQQQPHHTTQLCEC